MKTFTDFSGTEIVSRFRERGDSLVATASQALEAGKGLLEEIHVDAGVCRRHMAGMRDGLAPGSLLSALADAARKANRAEESAQRETLETAFSTFGNGVQEARTSTGQFLEATRRLEVHVQRSVEVAESAVMAILALEDVCTRKQDLVESLSAGLKRLRAITGSQR